MAIIATLCIIDIASRNQRKQAFLTSVPCVANRIGLPSEKKRQNSDWQNEISFAFVCIIRKQNSFEFLIFRKRARPAKLAAHLFSPDKLNQILGSYLHRWAINYARKLEESDRKGERDASKIAEQKKIEEKWLSWWSSCAGPKGEKGAKVIFTSTIFEGKSPDHWHR